MDRRRTDVVMVVADSGDRIGHAICRQLADRGLPVRAHEPSRLASLATTLDQDSFVVEGERVGAVLWRVMPGAWLSAGFEPGDQSFANTETAAVWLGAMRTPAICAVNAYSATAWYGGAQWPVWRNLLRRHEVRVSPMRLGQPGATGQACWLPLSAFAMHPLPDEAVSKALAIATTECTPSASALAVCGQVLGHAASSHLQAAASALWDQGVGLARVLVDDNECVLAVDPAPACNDDDVARISHRLSEVFDAHLCAG